MVILDWFLVIVQKSSIPILDEYYAKFLTKKMSFYHSSGSQSLNPFAKGLLAIFS